MRRRNLIARTDMPYARPLDTLGTEIVSIPATTPVCSTSRWRRSNGRGCATSRSTPRSRRAVGAGVGLFVEKSGLGPLDEVRITSMSEARSR